MEIQAVLFAVGIIGFAAWTGGVWHQATKMAVAEYQQKLEAKDEELVAAAKKEQDAGAAKIIDMQAAYEAGAENAKSISDKIYARSKTYEQANKAFANVACNVGDQWVQLINYSSANMRAAATAEFSDAGLPAAGATGGRTVGDTGKPDAPGPQPVRPLGTVPPKPRPINRAGALPR